MIKPIDFNKVADIYDFYVNVLFDVPFFLNETSHVKGEILELMCGTGRLSIPLLNAGRELVRIDYSQGMLDQFAAKVSNKGYKLTILNADVTNLSLNRKFDAIILPFHSSQEVVIKEKQMYVLKAIYNHLSENGVFVCTLQNPKIRLQNSDGLIRVMGKFKTDTNNDLIISYSNLYQNGLVKGFQFYEIYNSENQLILKRYLEINFRPIDFDEFKEMIEKVGFKIDNVYGDYNYSSFNIEQSPFMLFRLTK